MFGSFAEVCTGLHLVDIYQASPQLEISCGPGQMRGHGYCTHIYQTSVFLNAEGRVNRLEVGLQKIDFNSTSSLSTAMTSLFKHINEQEDYRACKIEKAEHA